MPLLGPRAHSLFLPSLFPGAEHMDCQRPLIAGFWRGWASGDTGRRPERGWARFPPNDGLSSRRHPCCAGRAWEKPRRTSCYCITPHDLFILFPFIIHYLLFLLKLLRCSSGPTFVKPPRSLSLPGHPPSSAPSAQSVAPHCESPSLPVPRGS